MNFNDLPPDYLRELVKWSPDFSLVCHRLSKTIYLATKTVKLEYCKDIPPKQFEIRRHLTRTSHPFGCVSYYQNFFFTSALWMKTQQQRIHGESFDIKGCFGFPGDTIRLVTVKSSRTYGKVCFEMSSRYFGVSHPIERKNHFSETLFKIFKLEATCHSYLPFKAIKTSTLFSDDICLDCQTVFTILSTRKSFPLELCRIQTTKYFDARLTQFQEPSQQFVYVFINHLLLGLDSIHNEFSCIQKLPDSFDQLKLWEMAEQVRQKITSLE